MEINYNDMYSNYLMCKNCNRKTQGPEDYKNTKTGKVTKTCAKCRSCVLRSLAKRPQTKPPTIKQQIDIMKRALRTFDEETLKSLYDIQPKLKFILSD